MADELALLAGGDEAPAKSSRKRQTRDSAAPKKPSSAMTIFIDAKKAALKAAEPSLTIMEANKKLAEQWKTLSAKDRAQYQKKAQADKTRYDEEMSEYEPTADSLLRSTKSGTRLQKDPKRPKKPKTAYLCFADKYRGELAKSNPGAGVSVLSKLIADKWKEATAAEKTQFEAQAQADKDRFQEAMGSYEPSEAYLAAKEQFKQMKKASKSGAPPPPPLVTVASVFDGSLSLEEQNRQLKEQIEAQAAKLKEQEETIEMLKKGEAAAEKPSRKRAPSAPAAEPPAKKAAKTPVAKAPVAKAPKAAVEIPDDEAHYQAWVATKLGPDGALASPAMVKANESKGAAGIAALLRKEFLKEMKANPTAAAEPAPPKPAAKSAPKPAAKASAPEPELPAKRSRRAA